MDIKSIVLDLCAYDDEQEWFEFKENWFQPEALGEYVSALLNTIEAGMRSNGITTARIHLCVSQEQWLESYSFYPKHGYTEYELRYMMKKL